MGTKMNNNIEIQNVNLSYSGDLEIKGIKQLSLIHIIERLEKAEKYILEQKIKSVKKQHEKIMKDPFDIKMVDIEEALAYKDDLEMTQELEEMYTVIEKWYQDNK